MSERAAARLAWTVVGLALACALGGLVIRLVLVGEPAADSRGTSSIVLPLLGALPFALVGGLVAARRPGNAVGWLMLGFGVIVSAAFTLDAVVLYDLTHPESIPGASAIAWSTAFLWYFALGICVPQMLLLFPSGRPPTPRWWVVTGGSVALLVVSAVISLKPGPLPDYKEYVNPFGISPLDRVGDLLQGIGLVCFLFVFLGAALSLVVRFRRSTGVERLQLKWVTYAVVLTAGLWAASAILATSYVSNLLSGGAILTLCAVPVTIGIAVLRYRLYEIDRVINRTLVYAAVTAVLGAAYVGLVLLGQALFSSFAGGSNLAIAVSTLVVAALFMPVRSRVQGFVDRRFYRHRYDAQRTLEGFGARLREQIDLGTLEGNLCNAVTETMQPTHVALWLQREHR